MPLDCYRFREDASAQQQALLSDQHSLLEELRAAQAQLARSQQQGVSSGSAGLAAHPTDTMEDGATADEQGTSHVYWAP